MEEILLRIQLTHEIVAWTLVGVVLLDFLGLVATVYTGLIARQAKREVEISRREAEENSRKISYYLFRKLGPIELD